MKHVFVTVGTSGKGFDRLIKEVDRLVGTKTLPAGIGAELGATRYKPKHFKGKKRLSGKLREKYINQSDVVVCDADPEIIVPALAKEKPVLVFPRLKRFGETNSDEQLAFARSLENKGKVLLAESAENLLSKINDTRQFVPWVFSERPRLVIRLVLFFQQART